jgi:cytochrome c5
MAVFTMVIVACSPAKTDSGGGAALDGKALVDTKCTQCHTLDRVTSSKMTGDEWAKTVNDMVSKGLQVTDAEKQAIVTYLSDTYK